MEYSLLWEKRTERVREEDLLRYFHAKKSVVESFFSWIESCKKVYPRYEIKETSYLGVVMLAAIMRVHEVLG